ncbi:MAG: MFS transporter [Candidatus Thermoplasmatota archaeon]|nr:MFS transporter [Candidatus Thermoplasmatota archaeon]
MLAFTMFVIVTTEFVVVGLLPARAKDLDLSLAEAGWFVTWFALAAALLGPPLTMLAGRCDPRRVLITAAIVFAAGNLAIALASHSSIVVAVRLLQGCALPAVASVAAVAAARLAGAEREGWAISRVNIGVVAATVPGVPAGAMAAGESLSSLLGLVVGLWGAAHMAAFVITQVRVMRAGREAAAFALSLNISVCNLGIGLGATLGGRIVDHHGVGAVGYGGAAAAAAALLIAIAMTAARSRAPATT